MRIKDQKYYSYDGSRRPKSRYIYLGGEFKCALTWYDNDIKYAIVFNNSLDMHKFRKDNSGANGLTLENKHIAKPGNNSLVMDYSTGKPIVDYYLIDNKYIKNKTDDGEVFSKKKAIVDLEKQLIGEIRPWILGNIRREIEAIKSTMTHKELVELTLKPGEEYDPDLDG